MDIEHEIEDKMLNAGAYHTLRVNRISDYGLFLIDEHDNEVLLPNRYVSLENKVDDMMTVFVYHDSEDRIVATTLKPIATVGEVAFLEVVDKTLHGAFLDWGVEAKHIFLPNRNMLGGVQIGEKYVVYLYCDDLTGRAVTTMAMKGYISNTDLALKRGQEVDIIVALATEGGYRVVINNRNWGMVYSNQIFSKIAIGDRMKAYVRKVTEDNRVDLSLQMEGYNEVKKSADIILELIARSGNGKLPLNDDSDPEKVRTITKMSKKVFKRTVGYLMKRGEITMDAEGIKMSEKTEGK